MAPVAEQRLHLQVGESPGLRLACLSYDAQVAALGQWLGPVRRFAAARGTRELRMLRVRIEDSGPFAAFRGRDVTARTRRLPICRVSRTRRGSPSGGAQGAGGAAALADRKGQSVRDVVEASRRWCSSAAAT